MPKIAIMTDSNCGIMPDNAQKYHIHILPMPVLVGEDTFYEGCNITSEEFYRKLSSGEPVTTSQPSPADVMKMWDQLLKEHDEVVHVPMSSGLSNSCQTALLLAQEEYFKGRVHVVDNHRISVTQAQSVLDAVRTCPAGIHRGADQRNSGNGSHGCHHLHCGRHFGIFKKRRSYHSSSCCHRNRIEFKAGSYHSGRQAGRLYQNPGNEVCF